MWRSDSERSDVPSIEELLRTGRLQRVRTDTASIWTLLSDAQRHLDTARSALAAGDLSGAYQLSYDAARKALAALLNSQGLRARGSAAHATLIEAVGTAFEGSFDQRRLQVLDRMRRTRNEAEYVGREFDPAEVEHAIDVAEEVVSVVARLTTG